LNEDGDDYDDILLANIKEEHDLILKDEKE
jgi:hypothetical protein